MDCDMTFTSHSFVSYERGGVAQFLLDILALSYILKYEEPRTRAEPD